MSDEEYNQMNPKSQNSTVPLASSAGDLKIPAATANSSNATTTTIPSSPPPENKPSTPPSENKQSPPPPENKPSPPPQENKPSPPPQENKPSPPPSSPTYTPSQPSPSPPPMQPSPSPPSQSPPPQSPPPASIDSSKPPPSSPSTSPPPSPPAPAAQEQNSETTQPQETKNTNLSSPNSVLPPNFVPPPPNLSSSFPPPPPVSPDSTSESSLPLPPDAKSPVRAPVLQTTPGSTPQPPQSPPASSTGSPLGNSNQTAGFNALNNNSTNNNGSNQVKIISGAGVAGVVIITFLAVLFCVRKRNSKLAARHANHQFMPPPNFTVHSDGSYNGHKSGIGNSRQTDSLPYSQNTSSSFGSQKQRIIGSSKTVFTYEEMTEITGGFSKNNIIGEGGFGCVYKAVLSDGKALAVKQLKAGSGQGDKEFKAEVEIISRVHHCHLVSLVGYCISEQHRLLIYEFVSNGTLEHHLHRKDMMVLDWAKRVKIAIGAAKGLAYLHEDCNPKIIHRDIKSANILLDDDFEARVADFGLARLNDTKQTHVSTRVMGTFGYLAPEYASSGKLTDRSDVFSFGVVLLELITGKKPVDQSRPLGEESLVEWARPILFHAIESGEITELVDPRLGNHYVEEEMYRMIETAASCVRHSAPRRPRMVQVVRALDIAGDFSNLNNGVKVGQSTAYDSGQYSQEIERFRRSTYTSDDFSDSAPYSGDNTSYEYTSHESENAFKPLRAR